MRRFAGPEEALVLLGDTLSALSKLPSTYTSTVPLVPWVHREAMASDELYVYATRAIPLRIIHWGTIVQYKTVNFIRGYLGGAKGKNPYVLFSMARCQIELLAAAYSPIAAISSVQCKSVEDDADQKAVEDAVRNAVWTVDQALVQFLYGSKPSKDTINHFQELRLQSDVVAAAPKTADDDWDSKNIVTLIEHASKVQDYLKLRDDYDVLCGYLHPNWPSNRCLTEWSVDGDDWTMRLHREGQGFKLASAMASVEMMAEWADETKRLVDSAPIFPFGSPDGLPVENQGQSPI